MGQMTNVISFAPPSTKPDGPLDEVATRQGLYLRAWVQSTDEKCGRDATVKLLEFVLERLRKRSLLGE